MQNPEEELKQYRQQIYKDVVFLMKTRLKLLKEFADGKNKLVWKSPLGSLSSVLWDSLFDNLIVTLSWLYSSASRDKRSLIWYINKVKEYTDKFSDDEIKDQFGKIEEVADIIKKVKTVRDSWVGHRDPLAFNNPEFFLQDYEINLNELETLIRIAEEIINKHFGRFEDTEVDFDLPINGIEIMAKGEQARISVINFATTLISVRRKSNSEKEKDEAIQVLLNNYNSL
ncbi:hypothetical protein BH10ACI1_BH10ACI1_04750 [soil metagenome]